MKEYIWLAFAILFMILSIYHFLKSKQKIDLFKMKGTMAGVNGLKTGVKEFIEDFNEYIAKLNKENKSLNLIASLGYLLASLTAIFSFVQEY